MTGRKTRLGLLALFLVATVGSAQTVAFLADEERAVIHFAGNAAGNVDGVVDTDWGAGNQAVSPPGSTGPPAESAERDRSLDDPPPGPMAVATPLATPGPEAPTASVAEVGSPVPSASTSASEPVIDSVDPPPPVPPPA